VPFGVATHVFDGNADRAPIELVEDANQPSGPVRYELHALAGELVENLVRPVGSAKSAKRSQSQLVARVATRPLGSGRNSTSL
jgi:hypothetical protein